MRFVCVIVMAVATTGCSPSATDQAEAQYNITNTMGTASDRCVQAQKVEQAYLEANNSDEYLHWKIKASGDCMDAANDIERYSNGSIIEPDNMEALSDNTGV